MPITSLLRESSIHVQLHPEFRLARSRSGSGEQVLLVGPAGSIPVGTYSAPMERANELLVDGAPLATFRDRMLAAGDPHQAGVYLWWLNWLCTLGVLRFPLIDDGVARAVVYPQTRSFVPSLAPAIPPHDRSLHRFACLRREGGGWLVESPLVGARLFLDDLASLESPVVRRALAAAGALEEDEPRDDARRAALHQWEFHDLLFHHHHRSGWHRDPFGAQFPYVGEIDPEPARRPPWPGERIELVRAPDPGAGEDFSSVLGRRRSERVYDERAPIDRAQIGALLDRSARIRSFDAVPVQGWGGVSGLFETSRRPYPSGGASYELEIYPLVARSADLAPGLYHYDAFEHALVPIAQPGAETRQILTLARISTANMADPQVVLLIAARFSRVMWKYRSISYGVILRNAGALYQTLYLAATELGIAPCGLGSGSSELFARVTGLDPLVEGSVAEFILGGCAASA